jgi:nitrate reductase gamma subunit
MRAVTALLLVLLLAALGWLGGAVPAMRPVFGTWIPWLAAVAFLVGIGTRVIGWARAPVPFRIPTTCGQQRSLEWIVPARLENPSTALGAAGRVALEALLFRSLLRNTRAEVREGPRLRYGDDRVLWVAALAFHWSLLVIVVRQLRFLTEPIPGFVTWLAGVDSMFQVGTPGLYVTDALIVGALGYLLWRRLTNAQVRYLSLVGDYFAPMLLLGIVLSGVWMRYVSRVDTAAAKQLALGLVTLSPVIPQTVAPLVFVHLFLLSALAIYFPWSKLVHMGGVFLSPTRNLANTSRAVRHVSDWDVPVKVHSYAEWEEEFREKITAAGLPMDGGPS